MWAEPQKSGKVKFVERYEHPLTGESHKVSVMMDKDTASTRKLAQEALQDKIADKVQNIASVVKKDQIRLYELVELYNASQKLENRASTCTRNKFAAKSLMRILGKDIIVERLTAGYVKEKLAAENEKAGTTNERITRLKALIRWGYQNDYIADIRWLDKLNKLRDDEKSKKLEDKYLEGEELKQLLNNMEILKWKLLTEFVALSGLRIGEAIALTDKNVNTKDRTITIEMTYDPVNNTISPPKTAASVREVYMQDELYSLCRHIRTLMQEERMGCGYRTDLFMSDVNGDYMSYYSYNKYLKEVSDKVVHKNATTHFLRHTHVALMAEQGIPLDVISRRLGHSSSKVTQNIYFHVTEKLKEKDNRRIKEIKIL